MPKSGLKNGMRTEEGPPQLSHGGRARTGALGQGHGAALLWPRCPGSHCGPASDVAPAGAAVPYPGWRLNRIKQVG